jgi:hypothetical protein
MEGQKLKPKRKERISLAKAIKLPEDMGRERVARGDLYWADKRFKKNGFNDGRAFFLRTTRVRPCREAARLVGPLPH